MEPSMTSNLFPQPQIGYYYAECCLLDLYKIETQEDLEDVLSRVESNNEVGQLMIFATLDEAVKKLRGDSGLTMEEESAELLRLGWTGD
jgi:hypothetical protein